MALKPTWFQILLALAGEDRHGSAIMRAVLDQTGGTMRLWPVMLYSSIEQLTEAGLIQEIGGDDRPAESERRRYYRITRAGRRAQTQPSPLPTRDAQRHPSTRLARRGARAPAVTAIANDRGVAAAAARRTRAPGSRWRRRPRAAARARSARRPARPR